MEALADGNRGPPAILNIISQARTYIRLNDYPTTQFDNIRVVLVLQGLKRTKGYIGRQTSHIPAIQLRSIILALPQEEIYIKLSVLFMFYAGLRQSEVAPPLNQNLTLHVTLHVTTSDCRQEKLPSARNGQKTFKVSISRTIRCWHHHQTHVYAQYSHTTVYYKGHQPRISNNHF